MLNTCCDVGFLILTIVAGISARIINDEAESYFKRQENTAGVTPAPIVIPPSQYFEGVDGQWSTFNIRVGTPAQNVRVVVSTNSPDTLVVLPGGCTTNAIDPVPADCASSRGGTFNNTLSKSWTDQGIFGINGGNFGFESNLGYNFDADYGIDTIGLGYTDGVDGPTLKNQTVAAYATSSPLYTGIFGLGTQPVIYQTFGNISVPSFFQSLRNQQLIPSLSWSYTAGAKYRLKAGQFAQLIFGGYDTSRYQPSSVTFSINGDVTRDLLVGVQAITFQGQTTRSLLPNPIYAFVESTDPNIWLPLSACLLFEQAFGIIWNDTTSMYLINSTQYTLLSGANPTVTFSLANTISGGSTVSIQLPFSAFGLQASYPFVDNTTYYFPLKRAANDTQYTLGRTFLQEAYLTVDYDRGNFSINQCTWIDGSQSNIIAIKSPFNSTSNSTSSHSSDRTSSKSISAGAVAGIVTGVLAIIALALSFVLYRLHLRKKAKQNRDSQIITDSLALTNIQNSQPEDKNESSDHSIIESRSFKSEDAILKYDHPAPSILSRSQVQTPDSELGGMEREIYQLDGESRKLELSNTDTGYRYELEEGRVEPVELPADNVRISELVSPTLGEEAKFVQLRGVSSRRELRVQKPLGREGNDEGIGVGLVMSDIERGRGRERERTRSGSSMSSGWRTSFFRGRDSKTLSISPSSGDRSLGISASQYRDGFL